MTHIGCFSIADLVFCLNARQPLEISENFRPFQTDNTKADFTVNVSWAERFPEMSGEPIYKGSTLDVFESDVGFLYCHHSLNNSGIVHSVSRFDSGTGTSYVQYKAEKLDPFRESRNWLAHGCFEELLIRRDRMILHASLIDTQYGGLLFCGPSGIGKSTQAKLWEMYEGCSLVNGDRPIVGRSRHGWLAYGAPYAGSSSCYINKRLPIRAVVMLEQGEQCFVRKLSVSEAFRKVYAGAVINSWNADFVTKVCDLIQELVRHVPIYQYTCTADQNAVSYLKNVLERDGV